MATVAHTIYSHYDPKDREFLERETGQIPSNPSEEVPPDLEEQWRKESSEIYKKSIAAGPIFVPAKIADGEWASYASSPTLANNSKGKGDDVAGWYKTLAVSSSDSPTPTPTPGPSRQASTTQTKHDGQKPQTSHSKKTKSNWFIQNVISASAPSSSSTTPIPFSINSTSVSTPPSPPTLAEILERDPPKKDDRYKLPIWIALGPGNKGFGMLQKSGWNEGEALGPYVQRRAPATAVIPEPSTFLEGPQEGQQWRGKAKEDTTKVEFVEVRIPNSKMSGKRRASDDDDDDEDEILELRKVEVVDLTEFSDDSDPEEEEEAPHLDHDEPVKKEEEDESVGVPEDLSGHGGTALLTPISTILKSDRLGIGLKPKLVSDPSARGAYRIPVLKNTRRNQNYSAKGFRVTSTQGVLDELRRREEREKREKELWGKGRRGKERKRRREEGERKGLLAYMNE